MVKIALPLPAIDYDLGLSEQERPSNEPAWHECYRRVVLQLREKLKAMQVMDQKLKQMDEAKQAQNDHPQ